MLGVDAGKDAKESEMSHQDPFDLNLTRALKLAGIACLCVLSWGIVKVANLSSSTAQSLTADAGKLGTAADSLSKLTANTDQRLNANGGLLQATQKAIAGVKSAAVEAAIAEKSYSNDLKSNSDKITEHLDKSLAGLDKSQAQVAEDVHETSLQVRTALDAVSPLLNQGTQTLKDADAVIADPAIPELLSNLELAAAHGQETMGHIDGMSADLQDSLHAKLHPTKKSLALGWALTLIKIGASLSPLY